mmetsp:Transcript_12623/g.42703  ORF Transcript_12623/g.42703 Transcript_12623/m.42703 type:complete len:244 (+) Transcript_12623:344-1075(+)
MGAAPSAPPAPGADTATRSRIQLSSTSSASWVSRDLATSIPWARTRARSAGLAEEWIMRARMDAASGQKDTRTTAFWLSPAGVRRRANAGASAGRPPSAARSAPPVPSRRSPSSSKRSELTASITPSRAPALKSARAAEASGEAGNPTAAPEMAAPLLVAAADSAAIACSASRASRSWSVSAWAFRGGGGPAPSTLFSKDELAAIRPAPGGAARYSAARLSAVSATLSASARSSGSVQCGSRA